MSNDAVEGSTWTSSPGIVSIESDRISLSAVVIEEEI